MIFSTRPSILTQLIILQAEFGYSKAALYETNQIEHGAILVPTNADVSLDHVRFFCLRSR